MWRRVQAYLDPAYLVVHNSPMSCVHHQTGPFELQHNLPDQTIMTACTPVSIDSFCVFPLGWNEQSKYSTERAS